MSVVSGMPAWSALVLQDDSRWIWRQGKLIARNRLSGVIDNHGHSGLRYVFLKFLYANHNSSKAVRRALDKLLAQLDVTPSQWGLCIGAGGTNLHSRMINLDLFDGRTIDIVHDGGELPFAAGTVSLVVCQEVLEHVADYLALLKDIQRVLAADGRLYVQVPFQIGYHSGPKDYWRFSRDGLEYLFGANGWKVDEIDISVGHGTGFYRVAVEFFAVSAAALSRRLYLPVKALFAILLYPVKLADAITAASPEAHRIPGGYYMIASKKSNDHGH